MDKHTERHRSARGELWSACGNGRGRHERSFIPGPERMLTRTLGYSVFPRPLDPSPDRAGFLSHWSDGSVRPFPGTATLIYGSPASGFAPESAQSPPVILSVTICRSLRHGYRSAALRIPLLSLENHLLLFDRSAVNRSF